MGLNHFFKEWAEIFGLDWARSRILCQQDLFEAAQYLPVSEGFMSWHNFVAPYGHRFSNLTPFCVSPYPLKQPHYLYPRGSFPDTEFIEQQENTGNLFFSSYSSGKSYVMVFLFPKKMFFSSKQKETSSDSRRSRSWGFRESKKNFPSYAPKWIPWSRWDVDLPGRQGLKPWEKPRNIKEFLWFLFLPLGNIRFSRFSCLHTWVFGLPTQVF